jgi:cyclin C
VHHAHRPLADLQPPLALTMDEAALAHSVLNDALLTDLPLLHAPHALALAAAFLAVVLKISDGAGGGGGGSGAGAGAGGGARGAGAGAQRQQQQSGASAGPAAGTPAASAAQLAAAVSSSSSSAAAAPRVQKLLAWVAESTVPIEALVECTQELISLYEVWEGYRESTCRDAIMRFVHARGVEK